jgi:hypothetical protein
MPKPLSVSDLRDEVKMFKIIVVAGASLLGLGTVELNTVLSGLGRTVC